MKILNSLTQETFARTLILLLLFSFNANAQYSLMPNCVDSLFEASKTRTQYESLQADTAEAKIRLKGKKGTVVFDDVAILSWLQKMDMDSLKAYRLQDREKEAYILSSYSWGASGLGINFHYLLIVIPDDTYNTIVRYYSLTTNPKTVYFDEYSNAMKFTKIHFGDYFFETRDWEFMDFTIEEYKIENGTEQSIKRYNSCCDWR